MTEQQTQTNQLPKTPQQEMLDRLQDDSPPDNISTDAKISELFHRIVVLESHRVDNGELQRRLVRHETAIANLDTLVNKMRDWLKTRPWKGGQANGKS